MADAFVAAPVRRDSVCFAARRASRQMRKIAILCDFDGTVAQDDVGNLLFNTFGKNGESHEVVERWKRGEISSRECLEREADLAEVTRSELDRFILQRRLDPYFKDFHDFAKKRGIEVVVVSDGLDYYVETMLVRNGLGEIEFFANRLKIVDNRLSVDFPYYDLLECTDCGCCKAHHLYRYRDEGYFIIYVGNGLSDRCPCESADMVFAKGELLDFCRERGIDHVEFCNFRDVEREVLRRFVLGDEMIGGASGE
jgi:2-hydroxy-3-keto-5-methylthiopentenyl-1-phosphate phosphatase